VSLRLDLSADNAQPFDEDEIAAEQILFTVALHGQDTPVWQQMVALDQDRSFVAGGSAVYSASLPAPGEGVYVVSAVFADREIAQDLLYVLEE
jgi:hypothetical protein